jgi:hypothetical protein
MIRKLLILVVLALAPMVVSAQSAERNVLLTVNGTLYKIAAEEGSTAAVTNSSRKVLRLDIQNGDEKKSLFVPATLTGGSHTRPSLAFDEEGQSLFIFWEKMPNPMSSELLFCSFQNGVFSEPTSISRAAFNFRSALQIEVTSHYFESVSVAKPFVRTKGLSIHAVWWELTGYGEEAHYALITLENGAVAGIHTERLLDFAGSAASKEPAAVPADLDREVFRTPVMFPSPTHDGVDVVFANWETNRFNRVTIRPISQQGVIRVPDGVWRGEIGPPGRPFNDQSSKVGVAGAASTENLVLYSVAENQLEFMLYKNGGWSEPKGVSTSDGISLDTAMAALLRLVNTD